MSEDYTKLIKLLRYRQVVEPSRMQSWNIDGEEKQISTGEITKGYIHGEKAATAIESLTTELADSRAREAKSREALQKIELHTWGYPDRWEPMRVEICHIARAALSASEDATA